MTFMTPDGRPLDDTTPRDIARELVGVFEKLGEYLTRRSRIPENDELLVGEMRRAAELMRVWAAFGKWPLSVAEENELRELRDLVKAFSATHDAHVFANHCRACLAERRIRTLGAALRGQT